MHCAIFRQGNPCCYFFQRRFSGYVELIYLAGGRINSAVGVLKFLNTQSQVRLFTFGADLFLALLTKFKATDQRGSHRHSVVVCGWVMIGKHRLFNTTQVTVTLSRYGYR